MAELDANKYFGAGLATALFIIGLSVGLPLAFQHSPPKKPGYAIAVVEESGGGGEAADTPPDWGTVLKTADVSAGEAKTAACHACHNFDAAGTNNIGPGLYGVVGRKPGTHPGFAYSPAMVAFGAKQPIWDYEHIYEFIKGPQAYINGTKMTYAGLKSPQDRINIVAYLHSLGSNLPIPAPNPQASAPAAGGQQPSEKGAAAAPGAAAAGQPTTAAPGAPATAQPQTPSAGAAQGSPGRT